MKKFADHWVIPELRLVIECYKGNFKTHDAIAFKKELMNDPAYNFKFDIIVDIRHADIHFVTENRDQFEGFFEFMKSKPAKRKVAILADKPHQAVIATVFKEMGNESKTQYDVFSTVKGAMRFLGYPNTSYDLINEALKNMHNNLKTVTHKTEH